MRRNYFKMCVPFDLSESIGFYKLQSAETGFDIDISEILVLRR